MSLLVSVLDDVWRECRQGAQRVRGHLGSQAVGLGDLPVDLLAVDRDLARRLEAEAHGPTADLHDVDLDVLADPDALADVAGECEQVGPLRGCVWPSGARPAVGRSLSRGVYPSRWCSPVIGVPTAGPHGPAA